MSTEEEMAEGRNYGNITVHGHGIIGDHNTMIVGETLRNVTLHARDEQQVKELLQQLVATIQSAPREGPGALSDPEKKDIDRQLQGVVEELEKPLAAQDRGQIGYWLDKVAQMAASVPGIVKIALDVRSLLGF